MRKNTLKIFSPWLILLLLSIAFGQPDVSPDWVADAVFYQIFPERFRNGDSANDPLLQDQLGSWPHDLTSPWHISPWTSDWYQLQPWEKAGGHDFWYNAQRRRYGGDLQGIIDQLDYLQKLGVTALYLNPIFDSPSLHKYDAATYIHVDHNFGPRPLLDKKIMSSEDHTDPATWQWTSADSLFLRLVRQLHKRGMKIILDGVFNHVGIRHWAFLDLQKNGPDSPYKDWFIVKRWDDPSTPQNEFAYKGWVGVKELPEWREDKSGLVPPVKKHIFQIVQRWMDPNGDGDPSDGIDGWRLDVAEMIAHPFWKAFRKQVKKINPKAYITGEIFWDDWQNNKLMDPAPWLKGDEFDGVMNYRWAALVTRYFIDHRQKISSSDFIRQLLNLDFSYRPEVRYQLQNLMDSHDTDRLASNVVNPDLFYDKHVGARDNPHYNVRKPNAYEWRIVRLIALFQFTAPGPPMIYYGTEAGMWGGDDPDDRKPMVWPDFKYENEMANVSQTPRPSDVVAFDKNLFDYYHHLISLRKKEIALRRGDFNPFIEDDKQDVIGYSRTYKNQSVLVLINNNNKESRIPLDKIGRGLWQDLMSGQKVPADKGAESIILPAKSGLVLKRI